MNKKVILHLIDSHHGLFFPLVSCGFAEPIQASERRDKRVFLLDSCSPEQALGIRLQSIQDVISQVIKRTHPFHGKSSW